MLRQFKKGIVPLDVGVVSLFLIVCAGLFVIFYILGNTNAIIGKQEIHLSMEIDDTGSEIVSLLGATSSGKKHMELLGDSVTSNYKDHIQAEIEEFEGSVKSLGAGYSFSLPGEQSSQEATTSSTCIYDDSSNPGKIFIWPSPVMDVSSQPGYRNHPIDYVCKCHTGVDIPGDGFEVSAAADGVVIFAGWNGDYGNMVKLEHEGGYQTWYGHLKEISSDVEVGNSIPGGKVIGLSGNTGTSTAPHLHFEVRKSGDPIDPCIYTESAPVTCLVNNRCTIDIEANAYRAQVPVPGAQPVRLKETVELVKA